ncbi:MAG: lysophospholipid acyltransferase family protein, partial [Gemmataceae bacterium]
MKIRHPLLIKAMGFAIGWLVRLWIGTLRYRYRPMGPNLDPNQPHFQGRYLYAFWHENILVPAYQYGRRDIHVLISEHADGQLIAEACRHLGFRVVRGSATRGGARAVRQMVRRSRSAHLAITPDGPRGPRRQVQPGVVYLAALTGLPIVPFGIAFE